MLVGTCEMAIPYLNREPPAFFGAAAFFGAGVAPPVAAALRASFHS